MVGRAVPAHGALGPGHVAFRVASGALAGWRHRLSELAVPLEQEQRWGSDGGALYLRDPAGNSVEVFEGYIWGT